MNRVESAGGMTAVWGSAAAVIGQLFGWVSANATLCGLLIAFSGLLLQAIAARHNKRFREAEEQRQKEEHTLRMQLLQAGLSVQSQPGK